MGGFGELVRRFPSTYQVLYRGEGTSNKYGALTPEYFVSNKVK